VDPSSAIRDILRGVTVPGRPQSPRSRWLAGAGFVASAVAVFACGWLSMQTSDWRLMIVYALLAIVPAVLAGAFARRR
jgi:hypothetical protein